MQYKTLEDLNEAAEALNAIFSMIDQEADVKIQKAISEQTAGSVGAHTGVIGGLAGVYFLGTVGRRANGKLSHQPI